MGIFSKQFIEVIEWTEPEGGVLAWRYPMEAAEIQNGAKLTVRDSQMAVFVNEGRVADVFGPGLHTLTTQTLPILTNLMHWDKAFESPFKSDVYFFSARLQTDQRWGTATPITIRDQEFGAVRVRGFGIYAYKMVDAKTFHQKVSGTREHYQVRELEGQLRSTIIARMADTLAQSSVPFLDMAANQIELGHKVAEHLKPSFADLGLSLETFAVQSLSLPGDLQKLLDNRIGITMAGDLATYAKFLAAQSLPLAAANEGGGAAGAGVGLAAGLLMTQSILEQSRVGVLTPTAASPDSKFCIQCGKSIHRKAAFCSECGGSQNPA